MNLLEAIQGAGENWIRSLEDASYIFSINDGIIYSQIGIETIGIGFYRAEILTGEWEIVTPEQLAKSREEFKEEFKDWRGFLAEDAEGKFINKYTQRMWVGWVRRQESLVVEIDKSAAIDSVMNLSPWDWRPINTNVQYSSAIEIVDTVLQSAGINYRDKE